MNHAKRAIRVAACSQTGIGYTLRRAIRYSVELRLAHRPGSDTLDGQSSIDAMSCGLLTGRDRIHSLATESTVICCGLLTGRDRIHSAVSRPEASVAACSRAGIGYTECVRVVARRRSCGLLTGRDRIHSRADLGASVAACSRAGIGYTWRIAIIAVASLRLAHGPGSDTLSAWPVPTLGLRLAHGPGSDTLQRASKRPIRCCGLLTGRDRIHFFDARHYPRLRCGLLTGRDRIHCTSAGCTASAVAACSRAGIGYTTRRLLLAAIGCGLLTGRDRIHSSPAGHVRAAVAACSQAGIGYTIRQTAAIRSTVAACSQAGIGYTGGNRTQAISAGLRLAHRPGSDTLATRKELYEHGCGLLTGRDRIHCWQSSWRRPICCGLLTGRDRIHYTVPVASPSDCCGLLTGRDRIHYLSRRQLLTIVAAFSQTGIGYTFPLSNLCWRKELRTELRSKEL